MLSKAERNLESSMDLPDMTQAMSMFGPIFETKAEKRKGRDGKVKTVNVPILDKAGNKIPVMKYNPELLKVKLDASKFVAERVGRSRYGVKEPEGGGDIYNIVIFNNGQLKRIATRTLRAGDDDDPESAETSH